MKPIANYLSPGCRVEGFSYHSYATVDRCKGRPSVAATPSKTGQALQELW